MSGETLSSDSPRAARSVDVFAVTPFNTSRLETLKLTLLTASDTSACSAAADKAADGGLVNGYAQTDSSAQGSAGSLVSVGGLSLSRASSSRASSSSASSSTPSLGVASLGSADVASSDAATADVVAAEADVVVAKALATVRNVIVGKGLVVRNDVSVRNIGAHVTTLVSKRASMAGRASRWIAAQRTTARCAVALDAVTPRSVTLASVTSTAAATRHAIVRRTFIRSSVTHHVTITNVEAAVAVVDAATVVEATVLPSVRISQVRAPKARESAPSVHVASLTGRKAAPFGSSHGILTLPSGRRILALPSGRRMPTLPLGRRVALPSGKRGVSTAGDRTRGGMLVDPMPSGSTPCHWLNQYRARQLASFVRSGELSSPFCGIVSR
ncbi:MAG: hypothetical protein RL033_6319 [Pseudomonadota bacterium]